MHTNGIQLNSESPLQYFHPTLDEYWQNIKDAVASNNWSAAQQAFALVREFMRSAAHGQTGAPVVPINQSLENVAKALETGDLSAAASAITDLQENMQSMAREQAPPLGTPAIGASPPSKASSNSDINSNLDLMA